MLFKAVRTQSRCLLRESVSAVYESVSSWFSRGEVHPHVMGHVWKSIPIAMLNSYHPPFQSPQQSPHATGQSFSRGPAGFSCANALHVEIKC